MGIVKRIVSAIRRHAETNGTDDAAGTEVPVGKANKVVTPVPPRRRNVADLDRFYGMGRDLI